MKVVVTGGRAHDPGQQGYDWLHRFHEQHRITELHHGACPGRTVDGLYVSSVDEFASAWATFYADPKPKVVPHPVPAWAWAMLGRRAGPMRNRYMIEHVRPDAVIAFRGGRGTAVTVAIAEAAGIRVWRPEAGDAP